MRSTNCRCGASCLRLHSRDVSPMRMWCGSQLAVPRHPLPEAQLQPEAVGGCGGVQPLISNSVPLPIAEATSPRHMMKWHQTRLSRNSDWQKSLWEVDWVTDASPSNRRYLPTRSHAPTPFVRVATHGRRCRAVIADMLRLGRNRGPTLLSHLV